MNKVQLIGRLTADPELKTTSSGIKTCRFTVAVTRRFNREETDFFPVTVWREMAENCCKYLAKGRQVAIAGWIQLRNYEDNNGVKRTAIDVQAEEVEFLTKASSGRVDVTEIEENDDMPF